VAPGLSGASHSLHALPPPPPPPPPPPVAAFFLARNAAAAAAAASSGASSSVAFFFLAAKNAAAFASASSGAPLLRACATPSQTNMTNPRNNTIKIWTNNFSRGKTQLATTHDQRRTTFCPTQSRTFAARKAAALASASSAGGGAAPLLRACASARQQTTHPKNTHFALFQTLAAKNAAAFSSAV
jgi:hypothetical protein